MPRHDVDRDAYVARISRRRRWVGRCARALKHLGLVRRPIQQIVYETVFRSDADVLSYTYAQTNDHLPDLAAPVWFNEKIRWLFLNHPNPLMTLVADKIAVRDYVAYKGATIAPPRIIATGEAPEELATAKLPPEFALKSSYGSGQNHIEFGHSRTPRAKLAAKVRDWMGYDQWRRTGEFHYRDVPKRWLVEELLPCGPDQVEYKIFCIMGRPEFILVLTERDDKGYKRMVYDTDWQPVDFHWKVSPPVPEKPMPRPALLDTMLEDARKLSEDFLQVRVDFLQCGDRTVFSELTFASAAARVPFTPVEANARLGAMIDLDRAPEYLARGMRVAADLGWPPRASDPAFVWTSEGPRVTQHLWQT
ncbi:ATP-grasp fold amidoligase family protein [uncultured Amaricoccus sp.]|uniref:ATP-grasp fold amidoligase family protein n=1 Tax=uncultured Amaricoccus sp. TaxID=339341 RepID=UPI002619F9BF|nr:ATP-grasp fold amidoligase family protein [uncultured Amaricoccus sp.]